MLKLMISLETNKSLTNTGHVLHRYTPQTPRSQNYNEVSFNWSLLLALYPLNMLTTIRLSAHPVP